MLLKQILKISPFIENILKTDGTMIDDAEDLDLVMLMYNLLEYSSNYSDTTGSSAAGLGFNFKGCATSGQDTSINGSRALGAF